MHNISSTWTVLLQQFSPLFTSPGARRRIEPLVVLDGLALVSQAEIQSKIFHRSALVQSEVGSELCRCVELPSTRALA